MTGEPLRCHPSIIVENTLQVLVPLVVLLFIVARLEILLGAAMGLTVLALAILLSYWRWRRTLISFSENEVVIRRDTLFKLKKVLPYTKIAAVNINRGVVNRIFGTSKLMININSGYNAIVPEAALTFKQEVTERLRDDMTSRLNVNALPKEGEDVVPVAYFTPLDVVIHSLFSVPTPQTILGTFFLANSILEMYTSTVQGLEAGGSAIPSLVMFFLIQIVPSIMQLFRYYDFKVYRKGDTITCRRLIGSYKPLSHRQGECHAGQEHPRLRLLHRLPGGGGGGIASGRGKGARATSYA
jgi:putative membrane protein